MFVGANVVHIHPTTYCNLTCSHCYSSSGPQRSFELDFSDLVRSLSVLKGCGYTYASISGGEPTLYPKIVDLCMVLKRQGYSISLISNGYNKRVLNALADSGSLDFVAISFDGTAHLHDKVRQREGAFDKAMRGLEFASQKFAKSGAIISVTNQSLPTIPELVERLSRMEISKIHFRPIALVGRAREKTELIFHELPEEALLRLKLLTRVFTLQKPNIVFECDVALAQDFEGFVADETQLISPLVIKENGNVVPFLYQIVDDQRVGRIGDETIRVELGSKWKGIVEQVARICSSKAASEFYAELGSFVENEATAVLRTKGRLHAM